MKMRCECYLKEVIKGKKRGFFPFLLKTMLLPVSWLFQLVVYFRNKLYEKGWMRRYVPPVPLVISVGNIVAGGTGKTPVTFLIAEAFYERFSLAILSRGYRSKAEQLDAPVLLCEGQGPIFPASYCGDEPYIFAERFPRSLVIVGGDRKKASILAAKEGAEIILLDDAMQHRNLARDFDVVVVDATDPFGYGYFLPRGFLRESLFGLSRANLIVLNHVQSKEQFLEKKQALQAYTHAPVVGVKGVMGALCTLAGEEVKEIEEKKIGMFCAVAHPEYFRRTLEESGYTIVAECILADHDTFKRKELEEFAKNSAKKGAKAILCTEKDRVKIEKECTLLLPILWVKLEMHLVAGQEEWDHFLKKAEKQLQG